jgi:hypothetical protein
MSGSSTTRLSPNTLQVNEPKRYGSTLSLEEKCEQSFFLFYYYRMEDEAVLDRGASFLKHVCDEEEVEGKTINPFITCIYIAVIPTETCITVTQRATVTLQ